MLAPLFTLLAMNVAIAQDCSDFTIQDMSTGELWSEEKSQISFGTSRTFFLEGLDAGCDCLWYIEPWDETRGTLQSEDSPKASDEARGQQVEYFAPVDLLDCQNLYVDFNVSCKDSAIESFYLEVTPVDADGDNNSDVEGMEGPAEFPRCSVSGGGCMSPQGSATKESAVWLLFPLLGLGGLVRRRD